MGVYCMQLCMAAFTVFIHITALFWWGLLRFYIFLIIRYMSVYELNDWESRDKSESLWEWTKME